MSPQTNKTLERLRQLRAQLALRSQMQEQLVAFEHELCSQNRFFPRTEILGWVDKIAPMVLRTLPAGTTLYRARVITKAQENAFLAPIYDSLDLFATNYVVEFGRTRLAEAYIESEIERLESGGAPFDLAGLKKQLSAFTKKDWWGFDQKASDAAPSDLTGNGRINPAGISYLYASNKKDTATLEVRPVISQMVSIAEVVIREEITLFDLTRNVFDDEVADDEARMFRKLLAQYFSKPNYSGDKAYLVTQYLSEYVKSVIGATTGLSFDGISFSSSLDREGTNYVIFDTTEHPKYEIVCSSLEKVVAVDGTLETYLPMSDATLRALMNGTL